MSHLPQKKDKLQPSRLQTAIIDCIKNLGIDIKDQSDTSIIFDYKGSEVTYHAYSGWASGKTIKDGRGLINLLKQLK